MLQTRALHGHVFSRAAALALLLGTFALLAACDGANSAPSSTILLASAAQKLINDSAFHFVLTEANPGTPSGSGFDVRAAEGDFVAPNKLQAPNVTAYISPIGPISTGAIVISNQAWYKNPLTGQYQDAGSLSGQFQSVTSFLGPGLAAVLASLRNVSAPSNSSVNGVSTWKITATVSSDKLSQLTNGEVTSTRASRCSSNRPKRQPALSGRHSGQDRVVRHRPDQPHYRSLQVQRIRDHQPANQLIGVIRVSSHRFSLPAMNDRGTARRRTRRARQVICGIRCYSEDGAQKTVRKLARGNRRRRYILYGKPFREIVITSPCCPDSTARCA